MMRATVGERHRLRAELALGVGDHRLHDVADEGAILRAARRDRRRRRRPTR